MESDCLKWLRALNLPSIFTAHLKVVARITKMFIGRIWGVNFIKYLLLDNKKEERMMIIFLNVYNQKVCSVSSPSLFIKKLKCHPFHIQIEAKLRTHDICSRWKSIMLLMQFQIYNNFLFLFFFFSHLPRNYLGHLRRTVSVTALAC